MICPARSLVGKAGGEEVVEVPGVVQVWWLGWAGHTGVIRGVGRPPG